MATNTTSRSATHSGTCQVCGRLQKLPGGVLSKHGYEVARWGFFNGVCWGNGYRPYELATDAIQKAIDSARVNVESLQASITRLQAEPIGTSAPWYRYIPASYSTGRKSFQRWETVEIASSFPVNGGSPHLVIVFEDQKVEPAFRYAGMPSTVEKLIPYLRARRIEAWERSIAELTQYISWQQKRIDTWTHSPEKLVPTKGKKEVAWA